MNGHKNMKIMFTIMLILGSNNKYLESEDSKYFLFIPKTN